MVVVLLASRGGLGGGSLHRQPSRRLQISSGGGIVLSPRAPLHFADLGVAGELVAVLLGSSPTTTLLCLETEAPVSSCAAPIHAVEAPLGAS
uniref:Uncharacterized protein n=1 Tax=Oryza glumipatula TaxID=40148 RepID=A0A0D9ZZL4_9ORYZ